MISAGLAVDVVFMDVSMPVMDGIDATQLLRRMEQVLLPNNRQRKKRIFVFALTALTNQETVQACFQAGVDASYFCAKPITRQRLAVALDAAAPKLPPKSYPMKKNT